MYRVGVVLEFLKKGLVFISGFWDFLGWSLKGMGRRDSDWMIGFWHFSSAWWRRMIWVSRLYTEQIYASIRNPQHGH
jgi:hypothetical protein